MAQTAKEPTGSQSEISLFNGGPKNQIDIRKIRAPGMTCGGEALLRRTAQGAPLTAARSILVAKPTGRD